MNDASLSRLENAAKLLDKAATTFQGTVDTGLKTISELFQYMSGDLREHISNLNGVAQTMKAASERNQSAAEQMAEAAEAMTRAAYRMRD